MRSFFRNKPIKEPVTDVHELLRQIERKDASFRIAQSTFFALILSVLAVLLFLTYQVQSENNEFLKSQSKELNQQSKIINSLNDNAKTRTQQISDLQKHIDCIVLLFQQPNHNSLSISDLQNCSLTTSALGGSTGYTKSGLANVSAPPHNSSGNTPKTSPPTQSTPKPPVKAKGLICRLTLGLLGCK